MNAQQSPLFLVAGQSNAVGIGDQSQSPVCDPDCAFEFKTAPNRIEPLQDPVGQNDFESGFQAAITGSAWPAFGQRYHELSGVAPIIVQAARGGSACHAAADGGAGNWSKADRLYDHSVARTKAALTHTGAPLGGIIWLQGESDAIAIQNGTIAPCEYKESFEELIKRFRIEFGCETPFFIIQTGRYIHEFDEGFLLARQMQAEVAEEDDNSFIVHSEAWDFVEWGWMIDPIHFDQKGLNHIGKGTAERIREIMADPGFPVVDDSCDKAFRISAEERDFSFSPNPALDYIDFKIGNPECEGVILTLLDGAGREAYKVNIPIHELTEDEDGQYEGRLDLSDVPPGSYGLRITGGRFFLMRKILLK